MADEYCDSCNEYMDIVSHPEPHFDCDHWASQFANWSAIQVWVYAIIGLIWILYGAMNNCNCLGHMFSHFAVGLLIAYAFAHLGWFIVVREHGCIHPIICAVFGVFYVLHGLNWVQFALNGQYAYKYGLHYSPAESRQWRDNNSVLMRQVLYGIYAVTLIYMGVAGIMLFVSGQKSRSLEMDDFGSSSDEEQPRRSRRKEMRPLSSRDVDIRSDNE